MSIKEKLFNAKKTDIKPLEIPEWEMTVYLRKWTLSQRSQFIEWAGLKQNQLDILCEKVLPLSLCEADGKPLMKMEDWPDFKDHDGEILERICLEALKLNGFNQAALDAAKKN